MRSSTILRASLLTLVLAGALTLDAADAAGSAARLQVIKQGDGLWLRSRFSSGEDLVVRLGKGSNRQINFSGAQLVKASAAMSVKELAGGRLIHGNGDDATPWNINGTYIGANHGCASVREVTCAGHGRTQADLGSPWEDAAGTKFYLIKIVDENRLWFLSGNAGQADLWKFKTVVAGSSLTRKARNATLNFTACGMAQLRPACRIRKQQYLVNGRTPLAEDQPVACDSLDVVEEYDIINPASLLRDIVEHPGVERDFTAPYLEAVIANHIVYRFHSNGANVIDYTAKALQPFELGYMGFIQSAKLTRGSYDAHEYYIPKTKPFTQAAVPFDFRSLQDYTAVPPSPLRFSAENKNVEDPANLPDRFIQFLGRSENGNCVREVGYALGYSLIHGLTRPPERARNTRDALTLHTTSKSYPVAINSQMGRVIPAGTEFRCVAYRQYFCPADHKDATCVYWHEEDGDTVFYADYHKAVNRDVLELPASLVGKAISVVEKTPSLTLHSDRTVPPGGVVVSVTGSYGYLVLRLK